MSSSRAFTPWCVATLAGLSFGLACATTPPGASDANLSAAKSAMSRGAALFEQNCASCHGSRGEGTTTGPVVMGGGALRVYPRTGTSENLTTDPNELQLRASTTLPGGTGRPPFNTAKDVFDYISTTMPPNRPGSLRAEEYWAILSFMLQAHGANPPAGGVTAKNAATVNVQPK